MGNSPTEMGNDADRELKNPNKRTRRSNERKLDFHMMLGLVHFGCLLYRRVVVVAVFCWFYYRLISGYRSLSRGASTGEGPTNATFIFFICQKL